MVATVEDVRRRARMALILRARTTDVNPSARSVSPQKAATYWTPLLGVPVTPGTPTAALPKGKQLEDVLSLSPEQRSGYLKLRAAGGTHARVMRDIRGLPARKSTGTKAPAKVTRPARAEGVAAMVRDNVVGTREATPEQVDRAADAVARLSVPQLRQLFDDLNVSPPRAKARATRQELERTLFVEVVGHARRQGDGEVASALASLALAADAARDKPAATKAPSPPREPRLQGVERQQAALARLIESARRPGEPGRPAREVLAESEARGTIRREGDTWVLTGTKATKAPARKRTGSLSEAVQQAREAETSRELADRETARRETARQIEQRRTPAKKAPAKKSGGSIGDALREQGERDAQRESADREARDRGLRESLGQSHTREELEARQRPARKAASPEVDHMGRPLGNIGPVPDGMDPDEWALQQATSRRRPTKAVAPKATRGPAAARVAKVASAFHEDWRQTRRREDGSFEPRVKKTKDQAWIDAHGTDEVDIANTSYDDLPTDWQAENRAAAEVVARILDRHGGKVDLSDEAQRQEIGDEIHKAWLSRNSWARGGELDKPFSELPADEQAKDVDQVAVAMRVLAPAKAAPAKKATAPRVPVAERRRQQRVDAFDEAIAEAERNPGLTEVSGFTGGSAVDSLRRVRDQLAAGEIGDDLATGTLDSMWVFPRWQDDPEASRIMHRLTDRMREMQATGRLATPRRPAAERPQKVTPAKAATPSKAAAPAKAATPRKATGAAPSAATEAHVAALERMDSREEAQRYLANIRGQELRDLARRYSAQGGVGGGTAQGMRDGIVDATVGGRLDSAAIRQGATLPYGPRPGEAGAPPTTDLSDYRRALDNGLSPRDAAAFAAWARNNPGGSIAEWQAQRR